MAGSFQEWLSQGESLYQTALKEYHAIEAQLDDLESQLVAKQAEVNQIAQVIGKPPVEGSRRLSAQIAPASNDIIDMPGTAMTAPGGQISAIDRGQPVGSNASIARALTGKFGR